jgi:uncharacterized protein
MEITRWLPFSRVLRERYGGRVRKIMVHAGFTCPNRDGTKGRGGCTFCDNSSFSPAAGLAGRSITGQIEHAKQSLKTRFKETKYLVYFQPFSNTYGEVGRLRSLYSEALADPEVVGVAIGTRADCLSGEIVGLLNELSAQKDIYLELGLETIHDRTLQAVNRCHSFADFRNAVDVCRGRRFQLAIHVILGLPGETEEDMDATARYLQTVKYDGLKLHNLYVVRQTGLADLYQAGGFRLQTMEEYCQSAARFLEMTAPEVALERVCSDVSAASLAAPEWARDRWGILQRIQDILAERDSRQGRLLFKN